MKTFSHTPTTLPIRPASKIDENRWLPDEFQRPLKKVEQNHMRFIHKPYKFLRAELFKHEKECAFLPKTQIRLAKYENIQSHNHKTPNTERFKSRRKSMVARRIPAPPEKGQAKSYAVYA